VLKRSGRALLVIFQIQRLKIIVIQMQELKIVTIQMLKIVVGGCGVHLVMLE
jgi:hypothetical protein